MIRLKDFTIISVQGIFCGIVANISLFRAQGVAVSGKKCNVMKERNKLATLKFFLLAFFSLILNRKLLERNYFRSVSE